MKRYILTISICLLFSVSLFAQNGSISFAWDTHTEAAQITGFKLYQSKTSGSYTLGSPVATFVGGTLTTGTIPKPGLGKYFWVLTAYLTDGNGTIESDFSNEVYLVIKPKPPKLNTVTQIALAPVKAITYMASIFKKRDVDKVLRIEKVE